MSFFQGMEGKAGDEITEPFSASLSWTQKCNKTNFAANERIYAANERKQMNALSQNSLRKITNNKQYNNLSLAQAPPAQLLQKGLPK